MIRTALNDYLDLEQPEHMLLVKTLPGTGKTTAAVAAVEQAAARGGRVLYAGPRHDLFGDIVAKAAAPAWWYEWQPRQAGDDDQDKPQTCLYPEQINTWLQRGYAGMDFCSGVCHWDYVKQGCAYHAQGRRTEPVIYGQHQHVAMGHPLTFSVLIGDESPLSAFLNEWVIPQRWIMPPGMDATEPAAELLHLLAAAAGSATRALTGAEVLEMLGGAQAVLEACNSFAMPASEIKVAGKIGKPEEAAEKPYAHLFATLGLLKRAAERAVNGLETPDRVIVSPGQMTLLLRRTPEKLPPHVIWLDATGRPDLYRQVFERPVEVVDAAPKMQGRIFQVVDRANGKHALTSDEARSKLWQEQTRNLVRKIISDYGYARPVVISYKDMTGMFPDLNTTHFYAARGTNQFEDADAVIVIGSPQPNFYDVVKMAKMLYFERDEPFKVEWVTRPAVYRFVDPQDGQGRTYPVSGFWNDPALQAVLETLREDEIIQAAHRGRPVNHPTDIWLMTNIPIDGLAPTELLTMRDVMGAPGGVDIFRWEKVETLMSSQDVITVDDIEQLGFDRDTARKYLDIIIETPGWEKAVCKNGKRGRPESAATKGIKPNDA